MLINYRRGESCASFYRRGLTVLFPAPVTPKMLKFGELLILCRERGEKPHGITISVAFGSFTFTNLLLPMGVVKVCYAEGKGGILNTRRCTNQTMYARQQPEAAWPCTR